MTKEIPMGWENYKLQDLSLNKGEYGMNCSACEYSEGLKKYIRITDIDERGNYIDNGAFVDDVDVDKFVLKQNDIVFARTGASVGKSYLYDEKDGELAYAGFLIKFSIDKTKCNPKILKYIFYSSDYYRWVKIMSARSGQPGINAEEYGSYKVCIPQNRKEQDKIVEVLDAWAKAVDLQEQKVEKLKEKKKALIQKLLTPKADWVKVSLNKLVEAKPSNLLIKNIKDKEGNYPVYGAEGVSLMVDFYKHDCDSIGIITYGSGCGKVCYITGKHSVLGTLTELHACSDINLKYVYYALSNFDFTKYKEISTTPNIYFDDFGKEILSIPSYDEQNKIVAVLNNIDYQIDKNIVYSEKLKMQQKALMQKLLTGEIRV